MSYEFENLRRSIIEGKIALSCDSRLPSAVLYDGKHLIEHRGTHNMLDVVRDKVGWKPNPFEIFREVGQGGEVVDWGFMMLPVLDTDTESIITDLVQDFKPISGGRGKSEVHREIGRRLPRIVMKKNEQGFRVIVPGVASLKINDKNIRFREESGGFDVFENPDAIPETQYNSVGIPLDPTTFFPQELVNSNSYYIKSQLKLIQIPQDALKRKINDVIQEGSYTENRLRSLLNITFSLGKFFESETFV